MDDNTNSKDYKYILVDRSDPLLMWNCAVSIIVFILLLFYCFILLVFILFCNILTNSSKSVGLSYGQKNITFKLLFVIANLISSVKFTIPLTEHKCL